MIGRTAVACAAAMMMLAPHRVHAQDSFVVRDVRVFDGEAVSENRSVLVRAGVIHRIGDSDLAVPPGTVTIDGRGRTLIPGLIDAHVHLSDDTEADLRQSLSLGVTTVLEMWNGAARFERVRALRAADAPGLADVRSAGTGATAPGGHPSQMGGPPFPAIADSADAAAFVAARIAEGSDFIKIIHDDLSSMGMSVPMLDRRTLAGLIEAAHAHGKLAVVHVLSESQARTAVQEGADGLVHLFSADTVSAGFADVVARNGAFVVPTLTVLLAACGQRSGPLILEDSLLRRYVRPALRPMLSTSFGSERTTSCDGTRIAVRDLFRAGVPVLAGTDSPVPGQTWGASVHIELALLVSAGATPLQALAAGTSAAARAFRLMDRGYVRPGLRADLVLVDGDPTTDILATRRIVAVWRRGIMAERVRYADRGATLRD